MLSRIITAELQERREHKKKIFLEEDHFDKAVHDVIRNGAKTTMDLIEGLKRGGLL